MTVAAPIRVRVTVTDVWDTVTFEVSPELTLRELKARALAEATGRTLDPAGWAVKYRGAPVLDEHVTVSGLGLADGAPLIVLPARRIPVR
jgi:hypothetical protein